jgi:hypothetical protein
VPPKADLFEDYRLGPGWDEMSLAVFRSADGGDSFTQSADGISELGLTAIRANPFDPDELAVSFEGQNDGGVLTSTDGGTSWTVEAAPPTRYSTVGLGPDGSLYAISSGPSSVAPEGLYRRTSDGGWQPLGPDQGTLFESDLDTVAFSADDPDLILLGGADFGIAGSEATIWRSGDRGGSWSKVYEVGAIDVVNDIEVVTGGGGQAVAVWYDASGENVGGALRSTNGGQSWSPSSTGLPAGFFRAGPLTVAEGVTCLAAGAQVLGEVNVLAGAGLVATAAVIQGLLSAVGATRLELLFTQITGPALASASTGTPSLFASQVTGSVGVFGNGGSTTVSGNTIIGSLSCFGNEPPPADHGLPNTATGGKLGQCADL